MLPLLDSLNKMLSPDFAEIDKSFHEILSLPFALCTTRHGSGEKFSKKHKK
jgi:hypothetical protein